MFLCADGNAVPKESNEDARRIEMLSAVELQICKDDTGIEYDREWSHWRMKFSHGYVQVAAHRNAQQCHNMLLSYRRLRHADRSSLVESSACV
jgi:hypothetical protein